MTPLLSALLRTVRVGRCRARPYPLGPRCCASAGHDGKHYVWSGFADPHWF